MALVVATAAACAALWVQGEIYRLSGIPCPLAFWPSHFWGGIGLGGLRLLSLASKPEIPCSLRWRCLPVSAKVLAAVWSRPRASAARRICWRVR